MTFVGSVEINGSSSLFAMSPDHFPLVLFSQQDHNSPPTIDAPPGSEVYTDLPDDIDSVTRARKERVTCALSYSTQSGEPPCVATRLYLEAPATAPLYAVLRLAIACYGHYGRYAKP